MLPKFRSFVRPTIRSFVCSFIAPIHRSSSLFIVHHSFIRTIHHHYSPLLFSISTIHRYYSSMISVAPFRCHYSSLLFIDHPITPNFNYSSVMLSLFTITIQYRYYSSLLFIDDICGTFSLSLFIVTIHRSSDHPKFQLLIRHAVQST
jgi:hypothetical protein